MLLKFREGLFERLSRTSLQFLPPLGNGRGLRGRTRILEQSMIGDELPLLGRRQFGDLSQQFWRDQRGHRKLILGGY